MMEIDVALLVVLVILTFVNKVICPWLDRRAMEKAANEQEDGRFVHMPMRSVVDYHRELDLAVREK